MLIYKPFLLYSFREVKDSGEVTMRKSMSFNPAEQGELPPSIVRSNSLLDSMVPSEQTDNLHWENENDNSNQDLATFLIQRACQNSTLANYFYW